MIVLGIEPMRPPARPPKRSIATVAPMATRAPNAAEMRMGSIIAGTDQFLPERARGSTSRGIVPLVDLQPVTVTVEIEERRETVVLYRSERVELLSQAAVGVDTLAL